MAETARRIADDLRARVASGELAPGSRLPGEPALVNEYGVAKETARRALTLLVTEGLAVRKRGSGTFVREFRPIRRVANRRLASEGWGSGRSVWSADVEERDLKVVDVEVREDTAPRQVARVLGLVDEAAVVVRSRKFLVDEEPVQMATSYLPAELVRGSAVEQQDTGAGGTYARLRELGYEPVRFVEEVRARMPSQEESEWLELAQGTPVIEVHRTAFAEDGLAVEFNCMLLDGGAYVMEYQVDG
ncbi:GntR family transcriptional regulator [Streptomyces sulphureus]|uniref:GntR family transcriptional regulator n=1 Tax=Streptomyces sulphureus TaxID=47758 RepID=UPI0003756C9D|nr:GntR family transcriptional regulator [Streptomyces sulphureus]